MSQNCFHCNEIIPKGIDLTVEIKSIVQPMCCIGCQAVAQTIVESGLTDYYQFRTEPANKGMGLVPEQLEKNELLDDKALQNEFTFTSDDFKEAILTIEGISCAACAWLIEMQLSKVKGIISVNVNATTQRATVKWQEASIRLSQILREIDRIGYQALPFKANNIEESNRRQLKVFIKRLGISGILMMQIMMIAIGLYFGAFADMSESNRIYLRYTSLILTIPIVTYGAYPFYLGAFNALRSRRLSMDVPVSTAIFLAFTASMWATLTLQGEVYFESVSMFTFLLLIGKFLEFRARSRAAEVSANLLKLMPMTATKLIGNEESYIAARHLDVADLIIIKPGEIVPADGIIISGKSQLNEAMLSGEQLPITKAIGDTVLAGTVNGDSNLTVEVKQTNNHSFLSQLIRLSETSQAHKPKIAKLSDKIAQYFVAIILITAICTAFYWHNHLPGEAFWITLSVLVATCPCALSLATPTALTCATTRLNKDGIMIKSAHVMETIPALTDIAFDKTGTLTMGMFSIENVDVFDTNYNKDSVLKIAAALESHSEHPLAKPFSEYRDFSVNSQNIEVITGSGVKGKVNGKSYAIGKIAWLLAEKESKNHLGAQCVLVANGILIATFSLKDEIREDAEDILNSFNEQNIQTHMLSGDSETGCSFVTNKLPINDVRSALSAEEKMKIIQALPTDKTIAMVGDGVNDTPVFGAAHVSIAMGSGTDVAKSGADVVLLNNQLTSLILLQKVSHKTKRIIWQNYLWAFGYNAIILPLAVSGFVTPYMAVIGMSASSILVITNSLRLLKK